jgi:hypothetical protein
MGLLDVRFHGICTHYRGGEQVSHRVVLLECDDAHRPLLAVPRETKIFRSGDPDCKCIVEAGTDGADVLYALHGVHLTIAEPILGRQELGLQELLTWDRMWACGVPSLTAMHRGLGPADPDKVLREPPEGVAAWFDVSGGVLGPYVSRKGAVSVRLRADVPGDPEIVASCWKCPDTRWTFMIPDGLPVRVSNDCGSAGDDGDFRMHFRLAQLPPADAPNLEFLPVCLPQERQLDAPPGWGWGNASLLCSNSQYP